MLYYHEITEINGHELPDDEKCSEETHTGA